MRAKKHLGQHFLTSKQAVRDIVTASQLRKEDVVLEIGPGKGVLTEALLESVGKVVAIEKDAELIPSLQEKFKTEIKDGRLVLIEKDILDVSVRDVIQGNYKLVANIPYYITGLLFRLFLQSSHQPQLMTVLIQKEVATRIVARDGKNSILSVSVKCYGTPRIVSKVPARYFSPAPKVDSAILTVDNISKEFFDGMNEEKYFELIKAGFGQKRKLLINNLSLLYPRSVLEGAFLSCSVTKNSRAENLTREQWKCVLKHVTQ